MTPGQFGFPRHYLPLALYLIVMAIPVTLYALMWSPILAGGGPPFREAYRHG